MPTVKLSWHERLLRLRSANEIAQRLAMTSERTKDEDIPDRERPLSRREIRLLLMAWGDLLMRHHDLGDDIQMFKNDKRPDVLYLVIVSKTKAAEPIALKTMETGA